MAADDFFARWTKRMSQGAAAPVAVDAAVALDADTPTSEPPASKSLPTLADVEDLTAESDYAAFFAKGVDETVRRSALKKLFALPQFNIMDGLDIYVGDYSQPDPLPPGMLEALNHARAALNPAQFFASPVSQLLDPVAEQPEPMAESPSKPTPLFAPVVASDHPAPLLPEIQPVTHPALLSQADALPAAGETHVETDKNDPV